MQLPYQLSSFAGVNVQSVIDQAAWIMNQVKNYGGATIPQAEYSCVSMLAKGSQAPREIKRNTLVMQKKNGFLMAYWNDGNQVIEKSFKAEDVEDISPKLPKKGQYSTDQDLIKCITSKYGPQSSLDYFKLPKASNRQRLDTWHTYQKLEAIFATLVLHIKLYRANTDHTVNINILLEPRLNRWVSGADLIILDKVFPGIFTRVIQRALEPTVSTPEKERIQELLNRLTEKDLLDYLGQDDNQIKKRRVIFLEAIQANYLPLLQKLTDQVLMRMVLNSVIDTPRSLISSHSFLIKQLSAEHLIKNFLGILNKQQFKNVLKQNPEISRSLTFEQAKGLLNARYYIYKISLLLLQPDFLHHLMPEQVVELAHKLVDNDFEKVINSSIFFEYVIRLDQGQIKSNQCLENQKETLQNDNSPFHPPINYPVNRFIMNLAMPPKEDKTLEISMPLHTAPNIIAKRPGFVSLLTIDELFTLDELAKGIYVSMALLQNDTVVDRLKKAGRLLDLIIKHLPPAKDFANRRLDILSAEELREFVKKHHYLPTFTPDLWLACWDKFDNIQWLILAASVSRLTPIINGNYSTQLKQAAASYLERLRKKTVPIETLHDDEIKKLGLQFKDIATIQSLVKALTKEPSAVSLQIIEEKSFPEESDGSNKKQDNEEDGISDSLEKAITYDQDPINTAGKDIEQKNKNPPNLNNKKLEETSYLDPNRQKIPTSYTIINASISGNRNRINDVEVPFRLQNSSIQTETVTSKRELSYYKIVGLATLGLTLIACSIICALLGMPFAIPFLVATSIKAISFVGGIGCLGATSAIVTKHFFSTPASSHLKQPVEILRRPSCTKPIPEKPACGLLPSPAIRKQLEPTPTIDSTTDTTRHLNSI
jgi:hypothetical protein